MLNVASQMEWGGMSLMKHANRQHWVSCYPWSSFVAVRQSQQELASNKNEGRLIANLKCISRIIPFALFFFTSQDFPTFSTSYSISWRHDIHQSATPISHPSASPSYAFVTYRATGCNHGVGISDGPKRVRFLGLEEALVIPSRSF